MPHYPWPVLTDAAQLKTQLRNAGLRATASRVTVLELLTNSKHPVSHAEVAEVLKARGWDRATLYRNLIDLTDAGLAQKRDHGDHVWRFSLAQAPDHDELSHPHFVCDGCGEASCLPSEAMKLELGPSAPKAVRERQVRVELRGLCEECE